MTRFVTVALLAAAALTLASTVACGGGDGERSVDGVVIDVDASSLTAIESFTVRSNDGETLVFEVSPEAVNDPEEGLFPGHLRTHAVAAEQVTVFYEEEDGRLLALRLTHD